MKFCKMKRFFSGFKKTLPFVLIFAVVFAVAFYPRSKEEGKSEEVKKVIRVWNVDTFEGGKGSRTNFLKRAAAKIEKKNKGVYYLITSYIFVLS